MVVAVAVTVAVGVGVCVCVGEELKVYSSRHLPPMATAASALPAVDSISNDGDEWMHVDADGSGGFCRCDGRWPACLLSTSALPPTATAAFVPTANRWCQLAFPGDEWMRVEKQQRC